jgi:hypothetical protein
MNRPTKVKLAVGAGAIVALAIAVGAVGALATAHVLSLGRRAGRRRPFRVPRVAGARRSRRSPPVRRPAASLSRERRRPRRGGLPRALGVGGAGAAPRRRHAGGRRSRRGRVGRRPRPGPRHRGERADRGAGRGGEGESRRASDGPRERGVRAPGLRATATASSRVRGGSASRGITRLGGGTSYEGLHPSNAGRTTRAGRGEGSREAPSGAARPDPLSLRKTGISSGIPVARTRFTPRDRRPRKRGRSPARCPGSGSAYGARGRRGRP